MSRRINLTCRDCRHKFPRESVNAERRCEPCQVRFQDKQDRISLRNVEARGLLLDGVRLDEIRTHYRTKGAWIDVILRTFTADEKARRARRMAERDREAAMGERQFAVPTGSGHGFIYGRLDGNEEIVAAVKARTGLDPWDYEVREVEPA